MKALGKAEDEDKDAVVSVEGSSLKVAGWVLNSLGGEMNQGVVYAKLVSSIYLSPHTN